MTGIQSNSYSNTQPQAQGLQANAVAFNEDEAAVLAQMMGAGVLSGAAVGAYKQSELGVSSLGLAGALQGNWNDQSLIEHHVFNKLPWLNNRLERKHFNRYYADPALKKGPIDLWQRTAQKHGMALLGTDGNPLNPRIRNIRTDFPNLEMHTVNANGEVLSYAPRTNNWFQKAGNIRALRLRGLDTSGPFNDSLLMRGHSEPVAESARGYANAVAELKKLKSTPNVKQETVAAAEAAAQAKYLEFDQIRLQEASKSLLHLEKMQEIEKAALGKLPQGTANQAAQQTRVNQINNLVEAQRKHVVKLNRSNAQFVAKHLSTGTNLDELAAGLMEKPTRLQRAVNFFNNDRAKSMQLYDQLKSHGFSKEQLQNIQKRIQEGNINKVKNALKTASKANEHNAGTFTKGTDKTKAKLADTVKSKGKMGALRNYTGIMGKVTKGLAIVGAALEVFNFSNNMIKGDHRKAVADLTTNLAVGAATVGIVSLFALPALPAIAAGMGIGMVLNAVAAPWVDKGFKKFTGLTNKNERDEKKLAVELNKVQQQLATVPVA